MGTVEKELIDFFESFDINSIPKEERIKQYISLSSLYIQLQVNNSYDFGDYDFDNDCSDKVYESFEEDEDKFLEVHTLPTKMLLEGLKEDYSYKNWQVYTNTDRRVINANVMIPKPMCANMVITADIKNNVKIIDEYMNERGYERFRLQDVWDDMGKRWALAIYTTKEQFPFNNYLVENNIEYLIHSAPITRAEDIDDMGVWPHSTSPYAEYTFDESAFYYTPKNDDSLSNSYINMMENLAYKLERENPTHEFVLYYINVKDVVNYVTFYRDPNMFGCCYTKSIIAPKHLKKKRTKVFTPNKYGKNRR